MKTVLRLLHTGRKFPTENSVQYSGSSGFLDLDVIERMDLRGGHTDRGMRCSNDSFKISSVCDIRQEEGDPLDTLHIYREFFRYAIMGMLVVYCLRKM